jgi:dTMP kinase
MPEQNGTFIVLEGADGSGKTTQFKLLTERLRAIGYDVEVFDFPQYDSPSSHFVRSYLNGEYGPASGISPYTSSLFYALDRYEAAPKIRRALNAGKIVLSNRYVGSNMAHQGGKFTDAVQQRGFFIWEDSLEYEMLNIPRPTINFFLRVPAEISYKLISSKAERSYTKQSHDEHEKDINHLRHSVKTYDTLCQLFPKDFKAIECTVDGKLLGVPAVNNLIWEVLKPILPPRPPHKPHSVTVNLDQEKIAEDAKESNPSSSIKSQEQQNTEKLVFELSNVSLLAASHLQHIPGISCEITTINWSGDKFKYYTPSGLSKNIASQYKKSMDKLTDIYKLMQESVKGEVSGALVGATPLSALSTLKITGDATIIADIISRTELNPYEEVRWLSKQLSVQAKKKSPDMFKDLKLSDEGIFKDVLAKLARETMPENLAASSETVTLLEVHPRNEFDLLVDSLYPYSNLAKPDIKVEIDGWSYNQKVEAFKNASKQSAPTLLENSYSQWSIIDDSVVLSSLINNLKIENLQVQQPTPRYGYNVSESLELAGIDELYIECFDESLKIYSLLQEANLDGTAAYSTLLGHKSRWQFKLSTTELAETIKKPADNLSQHVLMAIREKVSEVHPLISEYIESTAKSTAEPQDPKEKSQKRSRSRPRRRSTKPKK